jgi:hypothetical protein
MKKRIMTLCAALCLALLLCSCDVKGNPLPDGMDEASVLAAGEEIVTQLNEAQWQTVYDQLREDVKVSTTPEAIQTHIEPVLEEVGPFKSTKDSMTTGQTIKETGEKYGTAVFYCQHEKDQAMYRIAFSTDMELIGLQITEQ